MALTAENDWFL